VGENLCKGKSLKVMEASMDTLAKQLDDKLRKWQPGTADEVRQRVAEIIELADKDVLDISRSRLVEQEVLDMIDAPATR
jgi:ADP-glucose pyrophosphorylase